MIWNCGAFEFDLSTPIIMGVLNITPDSFSDGGQFLDAFAACAHAQHMIDCGAKIIDVGGESTRPGANPVSPDEEWQRIEPVVVALAQRGVCVSVDTRHAQVAWRAVEAGASIINDVSGFSNPKMVEVAANCGAGLVVMHMRGTPETMNNLTQYEDVVAEVCSYLRAQAAMLEDHGVEHGRICVDPGPGFAKTAQQTVEVLRNIHEVVHLGYPVMVAVSRKRFLAHTYHIEDSDPKARDAASAMEALAACELGASVVRTHNVEATAALVEQLRPYVLLGLGSNVALVAHPGEERDAKIAQLNLAIGQLCQLPDSQIIDVAPFYVSEPAYYANQEEFVNTVVLMRSGIPPRELLDYLHGIENSLGRVREIENGPRTIDIDILDYQLYVGQTPDLVLPHPRVTERDFVVKPLNDILPGHVLADGTPVNSVLEAKRFGAAKRIGQ